MKRGKCCLLRQLPDDCTTNVPSTDWIEKKILSAYFPIPDDADMRPTHRRYQQDESYLFQPCKTLQITKINLFHHVTPLLLSSGQFLRHKNDLVGLRERSWVK